MQYKNNAFIIFCLGILGFSVLNCKTVTEFMAGPATLTPAATLTSTSVPTQTATSTPSPTTTIEIISVGTPSYGKDLDIAAISVIREPNPEFPGEDDVKVELKVTSNDSGQSVFYPADVILIDDQGRQSDDTFLATGGVWFTVRSSVLMPVGTYWLGFRIPSDAKILYIQHPGNPLIVIDE